MEETSDFENSPVEWIEQSDAERFSYAKATWIPLFVQKEYTRQGVHGMAGHRKGYQSMDSLIVPAALRPEFENAAWAMIVRHNSDAAWVDEQGFHPPGRHWKHPSAQYPVLQATFDTEDPVQWQLLQEIEIGLNLLRQGDIWIRPEENGVEVAKIERSTNGRPQSLLIRAEHLRDYLCAKDAALLLVKFDVRDAHEQVFPNLPWASDRIDRQFAHGTWEGSHSAIHEGGHPFGMETFVLRMWRESVNPQEDVPEMPHPTKETHARSESYTARPSGKKLHALSGSIWTKYWVEPASLSPRIKHDNVESRVHFQVENQEQKTLSGDALKEYRGWLWFKPSVVRSVLTGSRSELRWFTGQTGLIGPAPHQMLHFGVNKLGLINVAGYKMAGLAEWTQRLWVTDNVGPDGGLSEELHAAQNLGAPARTMAPEAILWHNIQVFDGHTRAAYGKPLFQSLPTANEFFHRVHRFYDGSFEELCQLCKELNRIVCESIDLGLLNDKVDPVNAQKANKEKLRQIKRLALWLDGQGHAGRTITAPLAGIADLRQGDAHMKGTGLRDSLQIFGIRADAELYQAMCFTIIGQVANCIEEMDRAVPSARGTDAIQ